MRKITIYTDAVKKYNFLERTFLDISEGEYEIPFRVIPSEGQHNLDNCEVCRETRSNIYSDLLKSLNEFPNCCDNHKKLLGLSFFDKNHFLIVPELIADKIMFAYHHIINNLDNDDWYEDIIDYLEYCETSFGKFPKGFGEPYKLGFFHSTLKTLLLNVENKINSDVINSVEIKTRMNKVLKLFEPINVNSDDSNRDFNLLLSKYEEWYKIFPFELPFFHHLKDKFRKSLPICTGRTRFNKYLKTTKREIHTKDSFAIVLLNITKSIITSINSLSEYKNGLISDPQAYQMEIILSNRRIELFELSKMPNENKNDYVKILKKWLSQEKKFLNDITPYLKKSSDSANNTRPNRTDIAYCIYYLREAKELKLISPFPSEKAWEEIGGVYNKNWKNIQTVYNQIFKYDNKRLDKGKINNISYVIRNMLPDYPKALKMAKDDLNRVQ